MRMQDTMLFLNVPHCKNRTPTVSISDGHTDGREILKDHLNAMARARREAVNGPARTKSEVRRVVCGHIHTYTEGGRSPYRPTHTPATESMCMQVQSKTSAAREG